VSESASLEWDNRPDQPLILIIDELTAYGKFTLLLLPESFGEAAVLQLLNIRERFRIAK